MAQTPTIRTAIDTCRTSRTALRRDTHTPVSYTHLDVYKRQVQDFVIQEIFFTGTLTPAGKQYHGTNYVVLYNGTDRVLDVYKRQI